jgi:Zn-finger nucleic acid-binding protein
MREVNREGILIDVCTQCRGVWLDRGELEKLASFMGTGPAPMPMEGSRPMPMEGSRPMPPQQPHPDDYAYRSRDRRRDFDDDDDDDDRRYRGGEYRDDRRRSGMGRFLDFFD